MKVKLRSFWLRFNYACYKKLAVKERRSFIGYSDPNNKETLEKGLKDHIKKGFGQSNLVDIANYCNFLWNLIEDQKRD